MEIAKIVPFKDMQVEKPNTYKMIKSDGTEEIVKLEFAPGIIYEEGTKDNAENFNTIQNNCIYRVDGVRKLEATEEIYDINITNYNNYTDTDISIIMTIDVANTTGSPKIRLNNIKYNIVDENGNVAIGYFKNKNTFIFVIDFYKKTAKVNSIFLPPATPTTIGGVKSVVNDLVTASTDRPLSSNMGKVLQDTKLNLTGGTLTGALNGTTATFSGDITAPNIITDTSVGTCTTLFSGTQQCGQNIWKDTGIDIPTTYSSVVFESTTDPASVSYHYEFSRAYLASGNYAIIAREDDSKEISLAKITGNRLYTYTDGISTISDNNLLKVYGITRR